MKVPNLYRKVISFRSMRLKGSTQNLKHTSQTRLHKLKRQKICSTILFHFQNKSTCITSQVNGILRRRFQYFTLQHATSNPASEHIHIMPLSLFSPRPLGCRRCGSDLYLLSLELVPLVEIQSVDLPRVLPLDGQHKLHHLVTLHPSVYQHEDVLRHNKSRRKKGYFTNIFPQNKCQTCPGRLLR